MPLSEREQRLLDEMERSLYQNDADFVATVSPGRVRPDYRRLALGALVAVVGVAAIITGVIVKLAVVGIAGFIVVFAGVLLALSRSKRIDPEPGAGPASRGSAPQGSFMDRMNDRWEWRQDG